MVILLTILGAIVSLVGFGCWLFVVIEAFRDEVWKGLLCIFLCGFYFIYYSFVDFDHEYKWWILLGCYGSGILSGAIFSLIPH